MFASGMVGRGVGLLLVPLVLIVAALAYQVDWYGLWARWRDRRAGR